MNNTQKTDQDGKILIPQDLRVRYGIEDAGSEVELVPMEQGILIKKYIPSCIICGTKSNLMTIGGKSICRDCVAKLNHMP